MNSFYEEECQRALLLPSCSWTTTSGMPAFGEGTAARRQPRLPPPPRPLTLGTFAESALIQVFGESVFEAQLVFGSVIVNTGKGCARLTS